VTTPADQIKWNKDLSSAPYHQNVRILWCGNTGESSLGYRTHRPKDAEDLWYDDADGRLYSEIYVVAWAKYRPTKCVKANPCT